MKLADHTELKANNEQLNRQINESEQRRVDIQREFDRSIAQHADEMNQARANWKKESDEFVAQIKR